MTELNFFYGYQDIFQAPTNKLAKTPKIYNFVKEKEKRVIKIAEEIYKKQDFKKA